MAEPDTDVSSETAGAPTMEISNAISHVHKQYVGRGPSNARTTIDGDVVVCLLEGGFTRAEQTLAENDRDDVVVAGRAGLQEAMRHGLISAVERTLGRPVLSFMSANDAQHNLQVEVFVLAPLSARREDDLAVQPAAS
jgi:uncharacterized protein YbcI